MGVCFHLALEEAYDFEGNETPCKSMGTVLEKYTFFHSDGSGGNAAWSSAREECLFLSKAALICDGGSKCWLFFSCCFGAMRKLLYVCGGECKITKLECNLFFVINQFVVWRRSRDSNPGRGSTLNGFQDRRFRPLSHLSIPGVLYIVFCLLQY